MSTMLECITEEDATEIFVQLAGRLTGSKAHEFRELVEELRPDVQAIRSEYPLCQDHYDNWMSLLSKVPGVETTMACALVHAGAEAKGVLWALRLLGKI